MTFLRPRSRTVPVPPVIESLSPLEQAQKDFAWAAAKVQDKHTEIKEKEILFKRLLAEAPQDALVFDFLQQDLAKKKSIVQKLGGL
jgi:hypothetical protein